ncbi:hypothetical protein GLOIN_2v1868900 [Rhizophagus irregularis DAOM 181602=DAOM 197198]|nr:hypothetical protein GLOIN_2v1868900 [Rhizophagus irregularis DAOM 181602=DAOM 197198]
MNMSNIITHPYIFEALKSYFLRTSENNLVPTLSEFIRLNTDLVARSPPDSNKSAALQGYRVRLRPELWHRWSKIHLIGLVFSRKDLRYRFQRKRTREGETITSDTKKAKTFNVSFDEYTGPSENDRIEIPDDSEILDVEPLSGWEFDTLMPSWLKKAMDRHKTLTTAQTDPLEKFELAKQPIWWRIIDASDPKIVQDFIPEEEFSELNAIFSNVLNIGHQNDWTVLEPVAERCLQSLAKLNNEQIRMIELNIEEPDLFDDEPTNNKTLSLVLEENDYLDKEVGYILELVRYTCEILDKRIPQRKNSERDIDMFIKRHIFACFDDILDTHFEASDAPDKVEGFHLDWMFTKHDLGIDISYGREFSLCERAGSKVDNDTKNFSDILKVLKTLRDMHRSLVKAIAIESGGALSKQVLNACSKLIMPGFASSWFYFRAVLIIYVGGGFYASFELGKFDIPTSYDEIWKLTKIARIMLQIKKLLRFTVSRFKRIMERAEKEKFIPGKVTIIEANPAHQKSRKNQSLKNFTETCQTKTKSIVITNHSLLNDVITTL